MRSIQTLLKQGIKLSSEKELELVKKSKLNDKEALDLLIKSQIFVVIGLAKRYKCFHYIDFDDRVSLGLIAILHAVKKYNFEYKIKFSTYLYPWIISSWQRQNIVHSSMIKTPIWKGLKKRIRTCSIDNIIYEDSDKTLYDIIDNNIDVENNIITKCSYYKLLKNFSKRQCKCLLNYNTNEIAKQENIHPSRIRQIRKACINKIKLDNKLI